MIKHSHVGTPLLLILALANGSMNAVVPAGDPASAGGVSAASGTTSVTDSLDASTVAGGQWISPTLKGSCIGCVAGILVGGGTSIVAVIAFAAAWPILAGGCGFLCTVAFG